MASEKTVDSGPVPSTMAGPAPGPAKKQLPAIPDPETQQALSNKMAATKASSPRSTNNSYGQFFVEYSLLAEYNELRKQKLPGVYVIPSAKSALYWHGVLFVRQGLYQEGVFRFSVQIPESYPDGDCPRVIFDPPVFHPVIDPDTGELDVKRAIHKWRRNVHKIWQVLLYTRRIFFKIDTKNPLNAQAAQLYEQDIEMFKKKVSDTVSLSKARLYEPADTDDAHAIVFSPYDNNVHDECKSQMVKDKVNTSYPSPEEEKSKNAQVSGLTWIKPGSLQVFSREDSATA